MCPLLIYGQTSYHTKKKKAIEAFELANNAVAIGDLNKALTHAMEAIDKDDSFDEALLLALQVNLQLRNDTNAKNLLSNAESEVEPAFSNRMKLDLAQFYFLQGEYEDSKKFLDMVSGDILGINVLTLDKLKENVAFAIAERDNPQDVVFEKLKANLNGFDMQYFPSVDAFGQIVFTARARGARSDENLLVSYDSAGFWTKPVSISENINTERNEGTAAISADGQTLVFTGCNKEGNIGSCDLYISYKEDNNWSEPELLGESVNSEAWESQPSLSRDGKTLYFVSNRSGGLGKQDIYVSENLKGEWQPAVNLGVTVNTSGNDCAPFIYADNSTLFFSSDGKKGLGGLDLFKVTKSNDAWGSAENLGYPINNEKDQIGYSISLDGWAYYSEVEETGQIFLHRLKVPQGVLPKEEITSWRVQLINKKTKEPINAEATFMWAGDTLQATSGTDGHVNLLLERKGGVYRVEAPGFKLSEKADENTKVIELAPFEVGVSLGDPILFETNSAELSDEAISSLNDVAEMLKKHPELVVEVGGHTDAVGSIADNLELSKARSQAVFRYFLEKNVSKENLVIKAYGESEQMKGSNRLMVNSKNRKVELILVKIVKKQ